MMCPSYSLTSQRTQTLLNPGRKWVLCYNVWHTAVGRPPDRPALQNWWILMCHHMKMCHVTGKNGNTKIQKDGKRKWSESDPPIYQRHLKWEKGDVSKNAHVLPVSCTCMVKMSSTHNITSLLRAVFFWYMKRKETENHCYCLSCPFSFLCIWKQPSKGKRLFLFLPLKTRQRLRRECIVQWSKAFPAANEDQNPSSRLNY